MTNKVIRQASNWANCVTENSSFLKQNSNEKQFGTRLILKFFTY